MQQSPGRWLVHTPMTDPASLAAPIEELPTEVAALNQVVQGLIVHCAWLSHYGDSSAFGFVSRTMLPVRERLMALVRRDGRKLESRIPTRREVGTCRDFALMMCAFLRAKGTAARVRCGFASYFSEGWEDHWVCEYWNSRDGRWCLSDAQLDEVIKRACNITFDTSNVPRDMFLTAGEAWQRCRAGVDDPDRYGQDGIRGIWFMSVNVVRDALSVTNRETSAWDRWREAPSELRTVSPQELEILEKLARNPEKASGEPVPPWLESGPHDS
jgi:Transglutaminase-like superfamily